MYYCLQWTNMKATLAGAGPDGAIYKDFKPFTQKELRQHIALYIFNSLAPSPKIEAKLKPQRNDVIHGNDFIYQSFGPNAERRHCHFKCFFACQNPVIDLPLRNWYPNWKICLWKRKRSMTRKKQLQQENLLKKLSAMYANYEQLLVTIVCRT